MKNLWTLWICLMFTYFRLNAAEQTQETQIAVSITDLAFDQDFILANINGSWYSVNSLEKRESQWIAQVDFGKDAGYCQRGHDLCWKCRLCHKVGCYYYVEPCWK